MQCVQHYDMLHKNFLFYYYFYVKLALVPSKTQPCLGQCNDNNRFIMQQDTIMQKISCLIHNVIITITRLFYNTNWTRQVNILTIGNRSNNNNIISMSYFFSISLTPSYQQTIIPTLHSYTFTVVWCKCTIFFYCVSLTFWVPEYKINNRLHPRL